MGAFNGQKIAMVWDFAEAVPFGGASGGWDNALEWIVAVAQNAFSTNAKGQVQQADAAKQVLPQASASVWFTDPPYYDSVPYADLSDFFLVWLKRTLPELAKPDPYNTDNVLSPKTQECVWNQSHHDESGKPKSRTSFEAKFAQVAVANRQTLREDGIGCVVFAHKSTDGWEALLKGLISGGFAVTASWPIVTEMAERNNARGTASLMGSVHLVCRPRSPDAPDGDWDAVQRELPGRIAEWMTRLQQEGVRGADLVFACIGPALEVYSRYKTVFDAQDRPIPLGGDPTATDPHERGFLAYVWELVGKTALQEVLKGASGSATGLEEDARLTALFLWTLQSTATKAASTDDEEAEDEEEPADEEEEDTGKAKKPKGFSLPFDVVRRIAQPLGIHLESLADRTIGTAKGVVRLLPVLERADQLFGKGGIASVSADAPAKPAPKGKKTATATPTIEGMEDDAVEVPAKKRKGKKATADAEATPAAARELTTLDRVHKAMLLQNAGETAALRELLKDEQARGPEFLRLANALSPLYPTGSWEKQKLDAMLQALPK